MSHNSNDVGRESRRHRPAIIAIAVALLVVVIAYFVFPIGVREQNEGIATTPPPVGTTSTTAEGTDPGQTTPVAPPGQAVPEGAVEGQTAPASN